MIDFFSKNNFTLSCREKVGDWIQKIIESEDSICGDISFTFCDDSDLDALNQDYLNHKDFTDIITFDNTMGNIVSGDIFISTQRVLENSKTFEIEFWEELKRVLAHGILHLLGYQDNNIQNSKLMREKENEKMNMFHVEH